MKLGSYSYTGANEHTLYKKQMGSCQFLVRQTSRDTYITIYMEKLEIPDGKSNGYLVPFCFRRLKKYGL